MNNKNIKKPIGLNSICIEIGNICNNARMYKQCGLKPPHFIVPLDSGSGRTTLIEYMADMYKETGVLSFNCGLDDYLEVAFDGTLQQLKQAFEMIDSCAVYTNEYCNIIGMDISAISSHIGETQFAEFIKNAKRVCESAIVIFFVRTNPNRNEEKLLEKLCETIDNVKRIEIESYTKNDMCALIIKTIAQHGIEIKHETVFYDILMDTVSEFGITSVKDAISTANTLVNFVDFSGFNPIIDPIIDENGLKSMITSWNNNAERSEIK